jgi:tryptophan halogenase
VLLGQRIAPNSYHEVGRLRPPEQLRTAIDTLKTNIRNAVARMPTHDAFLSNYMAAS